MLRTNVLGSVYPTYAVVPSMKIHRSGRIIFVSSQVAQAALHGTDLVNLAISTWKSFIFRVYSLCCIEMGLKRAS